MKLNPKHIPSMGLIFGIQELLYGPPCLLNDEVIAVLDWMKTINTDGNPAKEHLIQSIRAYLEDCMASNK